MAGDGMAKGPLGDLDPEEFRRHGHEVVDWIAGFLAAPERYPVLARVKPGDVRGALPAAAPEGPEPLDRIFADFERVILPGITHWNHPGFFAYFAISGSAPGILGELLCAALNVNAMLWRTSPAATELEDVVLDWLRKLLGLPAAFRGVIYDTASISTLCALAAAREAAGLEVREQGMAGRPDVPRLRVYTSDQAHSSVEKGAIVLGLGREGVRKIPTDAEFRMDPAALARAVAEDRAAGWRPIAVCATVGTTGTTSVDPVPAIADIAARERLWLHVDAAYGGVAAILPERREVLAGCDRADSIVVNPHKWLFTPVDCSALFCRRPDVLKRAFTLVPVVPPDAGRERGRELHGLGAAARTPLPGAEALDGAPRVRAVRHRGAPARAHAARRGSSPSGSTATRTGIASLPSRSARSCSGSAPGAGRPTTRGWAR